MGTFVPLKSPLWGREYLLSLYRRYGIDNSNILSLSRKQLKPGTPFFTEAKLTMESILFIYEVSKSAFVQADFGIFFVREFVRMEEIDREFTNTMSSIIHQQRNFQREGVKIDKFVCEFVNS